MATKRSFQQDPEYDAIPIEIQEKQMKLIEDDARQSTKKKIEAIIKSNFEQEITSKDTEIDTIDDALHDARLMLDRLRACIITKYYATLGLEQSSNDSSGPSIHPSAKNCLGKSPMFSPMESTSIEQKPSTSVLNNASCTATSSETFSSVSEVTSFNTNQDLNMNEQSASSSQVSKSSDAQSYIPRFKTKCKIVVGNISKFIPLWRREENDQSTHKWMVYVRGDKNNPNIDSFVKKIRFLLHPSYRPNDIIEISQSPFHLIKRGWGEFPVRVQLHFHDARNKPVDVIHQLRLDKTFTGLQTLGAETVVELQLYKLGDNVSNQQILPDIPVPLEHHPISSTVPLEHFPVPSTVPFEHHPVPQTEPVSQNSNQLDNSGISVNSVSNCLTENNEVMLPNVINTQKDKLQSPDKGKTLNIQRIGNGNQISILRFPNNYKTTISSKFTSGTSVSSTAQQHAVLPKTPQAPNGVSPFVKCTDSEGRVLLVPQSSLLCIKTGIAKQQLITPPSTNNRPVFENNVHRTMPTPTNSSVPSYILKVVPNQESGQNQVVLIPMPEKKQISRETTEHSLTNSLPVLNGSAEKALCQKEELSDKRLRSFSSTEKEINNINLEYYKTFVELLKKIAKIFPLVKEGVDRSVFPFCASTLQEYISWNIGKQRASEWLRAGLVKTTLLNILSKKSSSSIKVDDIWSRKAIMLWCRKNGFTPMTIERTMHFLEPTWSGEELCSLNDAFDLISTLKEEKPEIVEDDEEVDIIEIAPKKSVSSNSSLVKNPVFHLPYLRDAAAYIKEVASQISIHLKPVETEPSIHMPVVEEMILSACMELATDLLSSAVNEGFKRMGGKLCPEEITISDVYSAVKKTRNFDFLTNSYLGIPKESVENT